MSRLLFPALLLVLAASAAPAQDPCSDCESGVVTCKGKEHESATVCGVTFLHRCDTIYRASCCDGRGLLLCEKCNDRKARTEHRKYLADRKAWLKEMKEVDLAVGVRFTHVETKHFVVHGSHAKWRFKDEGELEREAGTHVWAGRLEAVAARSEELFGPSRPLRHRVFLVWDERQNIAATRAYAGMPKPLDVPARIGIAGWSQNIFAFPDQDSHYKDRGLHGFIAHQGAEAIVGSLGPPETIPAWFVIGASHWLDLDLFDADKELNEFSFADQPMKSPWRTKAKWRKMLPKELSKDPIDLDEFLGRKDLDDLRTHAVCWSIVHYMLQGERRAQTKAFVALLAQKKAPKEAIELAFEMPFEKFAKGWGRFSRSTIR